MKVTVKKGEDAEAAVRFLDYLIKQYESYPILKTDMTIYFSLEDAQHRPCPKNFMDWTYDFKAATARHDAETEKKPAPKIYLTKEFAIQGWKNYMTSQLNKYEKNKEYMSRSELQKAAKKLSVISTLDAMLKEEKIVWGEEQKLSVYPFYINFHFCWTEKVDGEQWYFVPYPGLKGTAYGRLNYGPTPGI